MHDSIQSISLKAENDHDKSLFTVVTMILLLDQRLYFMNYDRIFRSYGCVLYVKKCSSYAAKYTDFHRRVFYSCT